MRPFPSSWQSLPNIAAWTVTPALLAVAVYSIRGVPDAGSVTSFMLGALPPVTAIAGGLFAFSKRRTDLIQVSWIRCWLAYLVTETLSFCLLLFRGKTMPRIPVHGRGAYTNWEHFSRLCMAGFPVLVPAWVAYTRDPYIGMDWLRLGSAIIAPLFQVAFALKTVRHVPASARLVAIAGGIGTYWLAWVLIFAVPIWPVVVLGSPILAGAASGQVVGTIIARLWHRLAVVPAAAIVGGAVLGLAIFYAFLTWATDVLWSDSIYIVPLAFSLWSVEACAAFLVLYLNRRS